MTDTVVVSAYYKIPSKKPHQFYQPFLKNWFQAIQKPRVVFFTTADVEEEIRGYGLPLENILFVHIPFTELRGWSTPGRAFWDRQKARDKEIYHTPELAVIWNEKRHFVARAAEIIPNAAAYIWCDAGCIRDDKSLRAAAAGFGTRKMYNICDDKLHLQCLRRIAPKQFYSHPDVSLAGAIIAGTRKAWVAHSAAVDIQLQAYDKAEVSADSDQYVSLSSVGAHPELYALHMAPSSGPVNSWFFFLGVL